MRLASFAPHIAEEYGGRATAYGLHSLKLALLMAVVFLLFFPAIALAQKISLSEKNIALEKLFQKIEAQSGYNFAYTRELMQGTLPVTIQVKDMALEEVLKISFNNQPVDYKIIGNTIVVSRRIAATADDVGEYLVPLVQGRVLDSTDGTPLVGATISIIGSARSTIADAEGAFELINLPAYTVLEFSFIGYAPVLVKVVPGLPLLVRMKRDEVLLQAVEVSTGLYKRPLATFTGAISVISGAELRVINPSNFMAALVAAEPALRLVENNALGSDPNNLPVIQLRGQNNLPTGLTNQNTEGQSKAVYEGDIMSTYLSNPNQPLLILDGFQTTLQHLNDMDINLIERVTVLKDAAATAAYGSRAANGVIVIETKMPEDNRLRLNYAFGLNISLADISSYRMMNAAEFLEAQRLSGVYSSSNNFTNIGLGQWYAYRQRNVLSGVNTDWLAQPLRNGYGSQHSLTLSGSHGKKVRVALGLAYINNAGVMQESNRQNINLNHVLAYQDRKVRVTNQLNLGSNYSNNTPWGSFSNYAQQFPYFKKLDSAGNIPKIFEPSAAELGFLVGAPGGIQSNVMYNSTLNVKDNTRYLGLINNLQMDFALSRSFHLRGALGVTLQLPESEQFYPADHTSFVSTGGSAIVNYGSYQIVEGQNKAASGQVSLDYSKQIKQHSIYVSLGASAQQTSSSSITRKVTGSPAAPVDDLGMLNGYNSALRPVSTFSETRNLSEFISATYTYAGKYTVEGTFNQSGSSQFGTNNRLAPFWALGASWLVDKENFFRPNRLVSNLRFFANLGLTGNQNFGPYAYSVYQYNMTDDYRLQFGTLVNSYATPNLKWQQTQKYSFGIQFSLLSNRVNVNASFFLDETDNLILPLSVAPSTGFVFYNDNLGATESKGYEITIGASIIRNTARKIFWSIALNGGHVNTTIKKLSPAVEAINKIFDEPGADGRNQTRALPRYVVGQSMTTIWAVQSLGIDPANGFEMFRKLDGSKTYEWDPNDKVPVADANASLKGAITTNFSWKGFSLNMVLGYQWGGYVYNQTLVDRIENVIITNSNANERVLYDRWKQPGDQARFKALSDLSITNVTSRFVQKNDYLDASSISLAYQFPAELSWVRKLHLNTPRIYFTQNNAFRLGSLEMERGTTYPFARTFSVGFATRF